MKKWAIQKPVSNYRAGSCWLVLVLFTLSAFFPADDASAFKPSPTHVVAEIVVSGKIADESGNGISGVSIIEKGTKNGVVTKEDGTFTIRLKNAKSVLLISHLGYVPQEIKVGNNTTLIVALKKSESDLDDVVVVGYGKQKAVTLTGSVVAVKSDQIITTRNDHILNDLSGKLPGVVVVQNTAEPGEYDQSNTFNIRGLGNPLIVIDGVAQQNEETFLRLNPNDIESISVLKDASAAVYGFKSANGVVLVTTKQGKAGKFTLGYLGTYGVQRESGVPPMAGPVDYMTLRNEFSMHNIENGTRVYTQQQIDQYANGTLKGTNWIDLVMKQNTPETQQILTATGGNDRISFYSSLSYLYQDGLFKNNSINYNKYSFTSNITAKLSNTLKATFNLNGIADQRNDPYMGANNFFNIVWNMNPLQTPFLTNTTQYPTQSWLDNSLNPYIMMNPNYVGTKTYANKYLNSLFTLTYDAPFLKGLQFAFNGSYDYSTNNNTFFQKQYDVYRDTTAFYLANPTILQSPSTISRAFYEFSNWMTRLQAEYKRSFGGHNIDALVLAEQSERRGNNFSAQRDLVIPVPLLSAGLANSDQLATMDPGSATQPYPYDFINKAIVGRLAYNWRTKYLLEYSFRYDGSSQFISSHQWGFFPSASAGWRISEEKFFKNANFLSAVDNLKLRASYGVLGDDGAATYQYMTGYNYPASTNVSPTNIPAGAVFDGNFISSSQNRGIANPDLTWYTSKTFNAGIDYSMWHGKLGITADFFTRNRDGLLATRAGSLSGIVGATMPQENLNGDRTHGFELSLTHHSVLGRLVLDVTLNGSYTRTFWKQRLDLAPQTNSYNNWRNNTTSRATDVAFVIKPAGRYQNWNQIYNSPWWTPYGAVPGDYYFYDYSGGGQQNSSSYTYSNNVFLTNANGSFPLMNFGSTVNLAYKNFDFAVVIQAATLRHTQLPQDFTRFSIGTNYGNAILPFMDRWHPVDPNANPYDPSTQWIAGKYPYTGWTIPTGTTLDYENATYIRLKSIELGYSLPTAWMNRAKMQSARFFVNGYNLLTWSKMGKYEDPEHPGNNGIGSGYAYPLNKTINFGVDVKF